MQNINKLPDISSKAERAFVQRAPRIVHECMAIISGPTLASFTTRIANISTSGMLICHLGKLHVGDVVVTQLPGNGDILGEVVRIKGPGAGVRFLAPISVAKYRMAITQSGLLSTA